MQLILFLQRSDFNYKNEYCKNKNKIVLPAPIFHFFSDKHPEVLYIIVSVNLNIGNDMDKGHYVCDVLDYNTGTW